MTAISNDAVLDGELGGGDGTGRPSDDVGGEWLDDVELTDAHHVDVWLHLAALAVVDRVRRVERRRELGRVLKRFPFLSAYLDAIVPLLPVGIEWEEVHEFLRERVATWEASGDDRPALRRLADGLDAGDDAITAVLTCALVEEDSRFGQVFAHLGGGHRRRPTFETVVAIVELFGGSTAVDTITSLIDAGAIEPAESTGPRSEQVLSVGRTIWDVLRGRTPSSLGHRSPDHVPGLADLVLPPGFVERAGRIAARWESLDLIVVRGSPGSDRVSVARSVAAAAGRGTFVVRAPIPLGLGAVGSVLRSAPIVELDLAVGEQVVLERPRGSDDPVIAVLGATGGIDRTAYERAITIDVPPLGLDERARRWRVAFGAHPVDDVVQIAAACRLQGAHIDRCAASAIGLAAVDGAGAVGLVHVRAATDDLQRQLLDTLATRLEPGAGWQDVVVGDHAAAKLEELETRCRHRDTLGALLGSAFSPDTGIGVRALFSGASGTGKTLAARVLAGRLGLDVYRVDLAAIVNKYVGETEKNLHRLFSTAEELDVVLLIDEADSLLGRRTEVRSANDRFANLETNYLLQRLEHYRGIVVTTSNAPDQIDPAFQRRMDVVVGFLPPSPRERVDIWQLHLPAGHQVPATLVDDLAHRCAMTGGQIRNAVMHAVLIAHGDGRTVGAADVESAVASEYQKAGAASPYDPNGRRHQVSRARSFHQAIA